jgi:hypothetical protein
MIETTSVNRHSILVMGVGRSGTTFIYSLLQHILEMHFPGDVDYVYEPFQWDRDSFNKLYTDLTHEFNFASSLSIDGQYHHKRLPMFVTDKGSVEQESKDWLSNVLQPRKGYSHYLGKMIRANGRISLIRELGPGHKFIFLIRNPVDVLNSASQLFSFYGSEFHSSDFDRFQAEIRAGTKSEFEIPAGKLKTIASEYLFWYFSNLAFLEYVKKFPNSFLTLSYEEFDQNQHSVIKKICEFIGIDFRPEYPQLASKKVGAIKGRTSALNAIEYEFLRSKLTIYEELLNHVEIKPRDSISNYVKTSPIVATQGSHPGRLFYNGFYASEELRKSKNMLRDLNEELASLQSMKRLLFINKLLYPLDRIRAYLKESSKREDD